MTETVENGERLTFEHESSQGPAGLVTAGGRTHLSYFATTSGKPPTVDSEIRVAGYRWRVTAYELIAPSKKATGGRKLHKLRLEQLGPDQEPLAD